MINFSPRFSLTGMTGTFSAVVQDGLPAKSTKARASINQVAEEGAAAPAGGDFAVPYNEQTGPTRYAPMMSRPPTAITKKDTKPLFPTSSVSIATTFLPVADVATTLTQSNTYSVSQVENTVRARCKIQRSWVNSANNSFRWRLYQIRMKICKSSSIDGKTRALFLVSHHVIRPDTHLCIARRVRRYGVTGRIV
jgi:hypothetical protein